MLMHDWSVVGNNNRYRCSIYHILRRICLVISFQTGRSYMVPWSIYIIENPPQGWGGGVNFFLNKNVIGLRCPPPPPPFIDLRQLGDTFTVADDWSIKFVNYLWNIWLFVPYRAMTVALQVPVNRLHTTIYCPSPDRLLLAWYVYNV